jgi:hypothetical protein
MSTAASESARMLDIFLPCGGVLVTLSEAYFDESYEDRSPRVLCIAGYVFRKSKAQAFGKAWSAYLRSNGLPYFHANEAAHRDGVFDGWTDEQIDVVSRKLIAMTKEYTDFGVAVAVDQDEYEKICTGHVMFPTAYAFVLMNCLYRIAHWRIRASVSAPTAYFFEQGHKHSDDAHRFLSFMAAGDDFPARTGYRAHGFLPKETPHLHPGDLLAWLWRLHAARLLKNETRWRTRQDLLALKRPKDDFVIFQRPTLETFRDQIFQTAADASASVRDFAKQFALSDAVSDWVNGWEIDYRDDRANKFRG